MQSWVGREGICHTHSIIIHGAQGSTEQKHTQVNPTSRKNRALNGMVDRTAVPRNVHILIPQGLYTSPQVAKGMQMWWRKRLWDGEGIVGFPGQSNVITGPIKREAGGPEVERGLNVMTRCRLWRWNQEPGAEGCTCRWHPGVAGK